MSVPLRANTFYQALAGGERVYDVTQIDVFPLTNQKHQKRQEGWQKIMLETLCWREILDNVCILG